MRLSVTIMSMAIAVITVASVSAQDKKVETVLEGLNNPCGIAIQPGTKHVFVSDSGAARIIRIVDGKAQAVITDFPIDVYGKGPMYNIGPLGLAFLNENTLVVGGGGLADGEELLRVYTIPKAGEPAIKADKMASNFKLAASGDLKGEGNFYGVAIGPTGIFVTANGDDTKGWVGKAEVTGSEVTSFKRYIATKESTESVDAPVAITIMPKKGHIVVGQMGEIKVPNDGLLTFYNANSGKMMMNLATNLHDITGLAYSPRGRLYATDFAWSATTEGGLFRLDKAKKDGKQAVTAKKMASLDKPTALVFAEDGTLYMTVIGTAKEGEAPQGKVVKIAKGL